MNTKQPWNRFLRNTNFIVMISLSLKYCEKVIFVWNDTKSGILFARFMCKYALEVSSDFFIGVPNGAKIRNWYDFKMLQKLISVHNFKAAAEGTCAARKKIKKVQTCISNRDRRSTKYGPFAFEKRQENWVKMTS